MMVLEVLILLLNYSPIVKHGETFYYLLWLNFYKKKPCKVNIYLSHLWPLVKSVVSVKLILSAPVPINTGPACPQASVSTR